MKHADKITAAKRLDDVVNIRLDGASAADICQFVAEKEQEAGSAWVLADGETPLIRRTIERYISQADEAIKEMGRKSREGEYSRTLARHERLYARAVTSGELGTALSVLKDDAALRGLYPQAKPDKKDTPTALTISLRYEYLLTLPLDELDRLVRAASAVPLLNQDHRASSPPDGEERP